MPLKRARQSGPHCRQPARITSVSLSVRKTWPLRLELGPHLAEIVDLAIVAERQPAVGATASAGRRRAEVDDRQPAVAEADARARSRRRCRRARDGRARRPSPRPAPDRPAWARRDGRCRRCRTSASCASPAARSASGSTGPSARRKASIAGRGLTPSAGASAETSTATARCGPPSSRTFIVSSFTPIPLPVSDVADAVEARRPRAPSRARRSVPPRPLGRRRRIGGPGPGAVRRRPRPGRSRPARAPRSGGRRRRWRDRPRCPARRGSGRCGSGRRRRNAAASPARAGKPGPARRLREAANRARRRVAGGGDGARPEAAPRRRGRRRSRRPAPLGRPARLGAGRLELGRIEPGLVGAAVEEAPAGRQDQGDDDGEEDPAVDDMVEADGELDARSGGRCRSSPRRARRWRGSGRRRRRRRRRSGAARSGSRDWRRARRTPTIATRNFTPAQASATSK